MIVSKSALAAVTTTAAFAAVALACGSASASAATRTGHSAQRSVTAATPVPISVWRPSNGTWYVRGVESVSYRQNGDRPVPTDFTGDGKADIAVWRPTNGTWYIRAWPPSSSGLRATCRPTPNRPLAQQPAATSDPSSERATARGCSHTRPRRVRRRAGARRSREQTSSGSEGRPTTSDGTARPG